jgi:transcriptional regulator with PAS, ATPase and Fis domain
MRRVLELVRKAAPSDVPVLIVGESGTGKELLARAIHSLSSRRDRPFVAENCGALAEPLLESELFGHERGAFTGATAAHAGLLEAARGGTLLLDEVGEMSAGLQTKLLRVVQEREVRRVGATKTIPVDVRIVAATHRDLEAMVAAGTFRADLFYRLNVVRIEVPPLRERLDDLSLLIDRFVETGVDGRKLALAPQARELLLSYAWPGNVRELENELRRSSLLAGREGTVRPGHLSQRLLGTAVPVARAPGEDDGGHEPPIRGIWRLQALEREMIVRALRRARGNKTLAARLLGIAKTSLYHRLERHRIDPEALEEPPE